MFRSKRAQLTFITLALTQFLDLVGFSIIIPILPPLFLDPSSGFFAPDASMALRSIWLGIIFALFGLTKFLVAPLIGTGADHYGRRRLFLITVGNGVLGYLVLAWGIYVESLWMVVLGRVWTAIGTGNSTLVRSSVADLTDASHRAQLFGYISGLGGLGFAVGPWIAGLLSNPTWLHAATPFLFGAGATLLNFLLLLFFFGETRHHPDQEPRTLWQSFADIHTVFHSPRVSLGVLSLFLSVLAWSFFIYFAPPFLVDRFDATPPLLGDFYGYVGLLGIVVTLVINPLFSSRFSSRGLALWGTLLGGLGFLLFLATPFPWTYLFIVPLFAYGVGIATVHLNSHVSIHSSPRFQGRVMGVVGSAFSLANVIAPLMAGPLAALSIYLPISVGAFSLFAAALTAHRMAD